nr:hypothetical protein [uncultured Desulfobulbus sp.]
MKRKKHQDTWLRIAFAVLLLAVILAAWLCSGPIKGDPEETMAQWKRYEQMAREYPAQ